MNTPPPRLIPARSAPVLVVLGASLLFGCAQSPLAQRSQAEIRQSMIDALQREIEDAEENPQPRTLRQSAPDTSKLEIRPEHLELIENEYAVGAYEQRFEDQAREAGVDTAGLLAGNNLLGEPTRAVGVSLERCIQTAVANNLDSEIARYGPAINQAALVQAEAAFDWTLFGSAAWQDSSVPRAGQAFGMTPAAIVRDDNETFTADIGLRRALTTGGSLGFTHSLNNNNSQSSFFGSEPVPNPSYGANFEVELNQPLMRGLGQDVNLAEVRTARNAERSSVSSLRQQLIATVTETERAYWTLVQRYRELVVRTRLLERGEEVRDDIMARRVQDARQAQVADAVARVERRRGDVLRARQALRRASDNLKRLINDPDLPVGSEALIIPLDDPAAGEIEVSLLDAITTAVAERPELERAILTIDDAEIREVVAKNARLPRLDLQARARLLGFDDSFENAYDDSTSNRFIDDWLIGVSFEQPIGNRDAEAGFRAARLSRMRSVVSYRQAVQQVVLEVKAALDGVITSHALTEQSTLSRIAQGEALRALAVEKELTDRGYTVERLNVELNQQEALANAEIAEIGAVIDYNISIADLFSATGTALERSRIDLVVPDSNQLDPGEAPLDYLVEVDEPRDEAPEEAGDPADSE